MEANTRNYASQPHHGIHRAKKKTKKKKAQDGNWSLANNTLSADEPSWQIVVVGKPEPGWSGKVPFLPPAAIVCTQGRSLAGKGCR